MASRLANIEYSFSDFICLYIFFEFFIFFLLLFVFCTKCDSESEDLSQVVAYCHFSWDKVAKKYQKIYKCVHTFVL